MGTFSASTPCRTKGFQALSPNAWYGTLCRQVRRGGRASLRKGHQGLARGGSEFHTVRLPIKGRIFTIKGRIFTRSAQINQARPPLHTTTLHALWVAILLSDSLSTAGLPTLQAQKPVCPVSTTGHSVQGLYQQGCIRRPPCALQQKQPPYSTSYTTKLVG